MNIKEVLEINSLKDAKLIAGKNNISNEVSGVNVLEALDVENWSGVGEIILTSYFALQYLSDDDLEEFFVKLHKVGVSALIIKIERLVLQIPEKIVELCNNFSIPLIQIGSKVKYESIILEILGPIIDKNVYLLNKYYEVHTELTSLALKMPSMEDILNEFKKMLKHDVSIINSFKGLEICTSPELCGVTILEKSEVIKEKYMQFYYERNKVIYNNTKPITMGTQISVQIPYLGINDYELIIHEQEEQISIENYIVIENAVKFLQMELLKKYIISQNLYQQKNSILSDLLNDRLYDKKDTDEVLESLKISNHKYYQVLLIKLYQEDENKAVDKNLMPSILVKLRNKFKYNFTNIAFMEKLDRIVFILNFDDIENGFNLITLNKILQPLVDKNIFRGFFYRISLSSKVGKNGIAEANREALDTQKVLKLFYNSNKILSYEDLGIYKLFLESNNLGELEKFISPRINKFRLDYPQLFKTLTVFLETHQNYTLTSEKLFLHPKSVRYRIDKTKSILCTELTDPEEILQIQVASRLFELMKQEEIK